MHRLLLLSLFLLSNLAYSKSEYLSDSEIKKKCDKRFLSPKAIDQLRSELPHKIRHESKSKGELEEENKRLQKEGQKRSKECQVVEKQLQLEKTKQDKEIKRIRSQNPKLKSKEE